MSYAVPQNQDGNEGAKSSTSRTLLEALAQAIDGTDEAESRRLAAQFNDSFGSIVRASVSTESEAAQEDLALLGSFGPQKHKPEPESSDITVMAKIDLPSGNSKKLLRPQAREHAAHGNATRGGAGIDEQYNDTKPSKNKPKAADLSSDDRDELRATKKKKGKVSSSEDSEVGKPKKKKPKKKQPKKKKTSKSSSSSPSSNSSGDSGTSSSESDSSDDSDEAENAELCYDVTDFQSADLPDLPDRWDKGFKKLRSYVPLTLFKISLLEAYYDDEKEQKAKDKLDWSKTSLKNLEKQMTYGDFIEMCDLEERYAREIYGLDTYADYVVQHKKIVSDLKKSYNCWMIGLRYHLKVRTVIFRRRKLIKSKSKGKTVLKDKVKIPNGLQPAIERQARHDANRAGDLQFVDNPYAIGGPKYGHNFATGRQQVGSGPVSTGVRVADGSQTPGFRGKRGTGYKKPFAKQNTYSYHRYNRPHGELQNGMSSLESRAQI